jgi:hypothetical protein
MAIFVSEGEEVASVNMVSSKCSGLRRAADSKSCCSDDIFFLAYYHA